MHILTVGGRDELDDYRTTPAVSDGRVVGVTLSMRSGPRTGVVSYTLHSLAVTPKEKMVLSLPREVLVAYGLQRVVSVGAEGSVAVLLDPPAPDKGVDAHYGLFVRYARGNASAWREGLQDAAPAHLVTMAAAELYGEAVASEAKAAGHGASGGAVAAANTEEDWLHLFHRQGFVMQRGVIPLRLVGDALRAFAAETTSPSEPANIQHHHGNQLVERLSQVYSNPAPVFATIISYPALLDMLAKILDGPVVLLQDRHNHISRRRTDSPDAYFHTDCKQHFHLFVTAIVYLGNCTVANGCTRAVPGSHLPTWAGNTTPDALAASEIFLEASPGDVLLMQSNVWHRRGPSVQNGTQTIGSRPSMTVAYTTPDELALLPPSRVVLRGNARYAGTWKPSQLKESP